LINESFLNWLTGFIEAEGSFPDEKDGTLSFYISQHMKSAALMYAIKLFLGFGKVRWQFSENMVHFVIEDKASMIKLANILNGRFRSNAKYTAFVIWLKRLTKNERILPLSLNTVMNFDWLAGFTEGDGSFFISIAPSRAMLSGFQATLNISWTQKHKDVLDFISRSFQGSWSYNKQKDSWAFTVKRQSEVTRLLALFELHPLYGSKRLDYQDLCLANKLFLTKEHLTVKGIEQLRTIHAGMNQRRP